MLKSISIEYYKGFYEKQVINFSLPNDTKKGSGLTLLLGPNNTGKTSLIEGLLMKKNKKFKESERHEGHTPRIIIEGKNGNKKEFTNQANGSIVVETGNDHEIQFELIPSRRGWDHQFGGGASDFDSLIGQSSSADIRTQYTFNLGPILRNILEEKALKDKFDKYIKTIVPHFTDWTIDTNDQGQDYIKYKTFDKYHQANLLGEGIISLFRIVAHLTHDKASTFIIDEPELSLHPTAQKRLAAVLSELSKTRQIIVSTHSPYFVDWSDFVNGATIVRLNKHRGEKCVANSLDNTKDYTAFISANVAAYQKPQLLDTTAKEILFSDKILFVEGQEDVGLLKKWYGENKKVLGYEIFGYGVGGETNMKLFLEMAKDLNIEKVGALYDSNATKYEEDKTAYPSFKLLKLPTEDIRDKKNECISDCKYGKDKEGIFTSNGTLKPEYKETFENIINEFESYYSL